MASHNYVAQNCLFTKTKTVSRFITNIYTKALKDVGVTPVQYSVLTAIQCLNEANINGLSSALKIDRTTINRNLKPLIRDNLLSVHESDDKREKIVSITKEGEEVYKKGYINWGRAQDEMKEILSEKYWTEMNEVLDIVIEKIAKT